MTGTNTLEERRRRANAQAEADRAAAALASSSQPAANPASNPAPAAAAAKAPQFRNKFEDPNTYPQVKERGKLSTVGMLFTKALRRMGMSSKWKESIFDRQPLDCFIKAAGQDLNEMLGDYQRFKQAKLKEKIGRDFVVNTNLPLPAVYRNSQMRPEQIRLEFDNYNEMAEFLNQLAQKGKQFVQVSPDVRPIAHHYSSGDGILRSSPSPEKMNFTEKKIDPSKP